MYPTAIFGQPQYTTAGYLPWQPVYQPPRPCPWWEEPLPLDRQPSDLHDWQCHVQPLPYQQVRHQHRRPYPARQPTSWDPPWLRQTATYQQPSSYEPDMCSLPPPTHRPTCWDPPTYWETPGQHPLHEVSVYDQLLPPDPTSHWNQPAPWQPCPVITTASPIEEMLGRLLEACNRIESRLDANDRRIDNLNIDAVYCSLKSMNAVIPNEVDATYPRNWNMVMLEDNKGNDGVDQTMDSGDQPMESGEDTPYVPVEEKSKPATTRQNERLYAEEDALLEEGELLKALSLSPMSQHEAGGVTTLLDCISKWSRSTGDEGIYIRGLGLNIDRSQVVSVPNMIRFGDGYNWTVRSYTFDPGGDISTKLQLASFFVVLWFHLEDKVNFNRGGVDTSISSLISSYLYYLVNQ